MNIPEIDPPEARILHDAGAALFLDVRDRASHDAARITGAVTVSDDTLHTFLAETSRDQKIVVYCYHGHASLGGAAYLLERGFSDVCSLRGGFAQWGGPVAPNP